LLLGPRRPIWRRWILLTLPTLAMMLLYPMVAVPYYAYDQGMYGAIGLLGILGLCWALERAEVAIRREGGLRPALVGLRASWSASKGHRDPLRRSLRISGVCLIALAATVVGGHLVHVSDARWRARLATKSVKIDAKALPGDRPERPMSIPPSARHYDARSAPQPTAQPARSPAHS
jgi:hypothetical protein